MADDSPRWVHRGFDAFRQGEFDNGGDNLYVTAAGAVEWIHRTDTNGDGHVDLVFPNSHGYDERGPTWIYTQPHAPGGEWGRRELPNDSGWMSRAVDLDGDGRLDLVVINAENGVTSELESYVYWGGPGGLTGERVELPTAGAYDFAAADLTGNGLPDLIIPSAWVDHHNAGEPRPLHVFLQTRPRVFEDATARFGIPGVAALAVACADLDGDGELELVVANYREGFEYDTDSFIYRRQGVGFAVDRPLRLPTHYAMQVELADLDGDGAREVIFAGGNQVQIYWNRGGRFSPDDRTILPVEGNWTLFTQGAVRVACADVDGDGRDELLVVTREGVQIRSADALDRVRQTLPLPNCSWLSAADLDGDGRIDLIASRLEDGRSYETESVVFWNGPEGLSGGRVTTLPTRGAMGCTAADLDGDGRQEIVFNNTMAGPSQNDPDFPLYVYPGGRGGSFDPRRRLELPAGGTNTYVLADLDQDGHADLVCTGRDGLRVFHGGPDGLRPDRCSFLPGRGQFFHYVQVGDFDRDGWLDLLGVAYTYDDKPETMAASSVIYHGSPDGFSAERSTVLPTYCKGNARVADLTGDGWLDVVFYDPRGYLAVYHGGPRAFSTERMSRIPLDLGGDGNVAAINCADLTGSGWLDLIVVVMGHYTRMESGFHILYGGPHGYAQDRGEYHRTDASSILLTVADVNGDGHLDLLVPAYSTQFSRVLPAHIYWGTPGGIDYEHPTVIPCDSSCAFQVVDMTGNGYRDVLTVCHRTDLGHRVDSLLFHNGPAGLDLDHPVRLPGMGPHLSTPRDFGNAFTREPCERYRSPPYELAGRRPVRVAWQAATPPRTAVELQLRWADSREDLAAAPWHGADGAGTTFAHPGPVVGFGDPQRWLQYQATLTSLDGCSTPSLHEVRVELA